VRVETDQRFEVCTINKFSYSKPLNEKKNVGYCPSCPKTLIGSGSFDIVKYISEA